MTKTVIFGDSSLSDSKYTLILNSTNDYAIATKRFDGPIVYKTINYKKKHYVTFEKLLFVLVYYFLKICLYSYLKPFKFSQVK